MWPINIRLLPFIFWFLIATTATENGYAFFQDEQPQEITYTEISGEVLDSESKDNLIFADLEIEETNIRTITNTEGKFLLKIPNEYLQGNIIISFLGYQKKSIPISDFDAKNNKVLLEPLITQLTEVKINVPKDPRGLVLEMLARKNENYLNETSLMTAFYRETIKKRRQNASLAEAVVEIYKQPYSLDRNDRIKLVKSRKSTNYSKLDTLAVKLQGGPFNTLYSDLIKYPEFVFNEEYFDAYDYKFENSTTVDNRETFVISFKQKPEIVTPLYYGKLYIDAATYALNSAIYNLNVENQDLAASIFVKKKPRRVAVYPIEAAYRVDYKNKNGKWYYGYSNLQLSFKVNWVGKLFNSVYSLQSEMVITDWEVATDGAIKFRDQIRPSVILADKASGFSDPTFWGEYNIIEPEKSIEQAIRKINRRNEKEEKQTEE